MIMHIYFYWIWYHLPTILPSLCSIPYSSVLGYVFSDIRSISGHFSLSQISTDFYYKRNFPFLQCEKPCSTAFLFPPLFRYFITQYEQPLHLILIDITAVLMIFFIQLSKPLFLFLLFFYFSFGCFLYFFRIFYILFYVGMFFQSSYSILSI